MNLYLSPEHMFHEYSLVVLPRQLLYRLEHQVDLVHQYELLQAPNDQSEGRNKRE